MERLQFISFSPKRLMISTRKHQLEKGRKQSCSERVEEREREGGGGNGAHQPSSIHHSKLDLFGSGADNYCLFGEAIAVFPSHLSVFLHILV